LQQLTRQEIEAADSKLQTIIDEVCGACEMNCCLQGTMVGSDDARRIAKAARLSSEFRAHLVEGLRKRGAELRRDLQGFENAARLLRARFGDEKRDALARLQVALGQWSEFCDFLERDFAGEPAQVRQCLLFSGLRATALRLLRGFPGGERVLPTLAGRDTSFEVGRRGIKADRCLFHVGGCLVPTAKPHKCADFYCHSDPGLIHEVVDRMAFDEFVLGHIVPYRRDQFVSDLKVELSMGTEFFEPKVILGADDELTQEVTAQLERAFARVTAKSLGGGHFDATVDLPNLSRHPEQEGLVLRCGSVDALGVYELAVMLVRARGSSVRPAAALSVAEFRRASGMVHPLWRERAMSQPLSAVNLIALVEE